MSVVSCKDCVHFVSHSKRQGFKYGTCIITLPSWMVIAGKDERVVSTAQGCSLGKAETNS